MHTFLSRYSDQDAVRLLRERFLEDFRISCSLEAVQPMAQNLHSALQHPGVVCEKNG